MTSQPSIADVEHSASPGNIRLGTIALVGLLLSLSSLLGWAFGRQLHASSVRRELHRARQWGRAEPRTAIAAYERYLLWQPHDTEARLELANLLVGRQPVAALQHLRQIQPSSPWYSQAVRRVAAVALDLGRDYDALDPLLFLQEQQRDDPRVQRALAGVRFRQRDFAAALAHARQARTLDPTQPDAWLMEAESLDELKQPTLMVTPLESALRLDPEIPQARLNLAYAYQLVGREEEALEHVQWFLKRFPNSAAAYRTLALVQRARGEIQAALAAVQTSLRLRPQQLDAVIMEIELLLFERQYEIAYQQAAAARQHFGAERRILTLFVRAARLTGRQAEAVDGQKQLSRSLPADDPE